MIETLTHTLDILLLAGANVMAFAFFVAMVVIITSLASLVVRELFCNFRGRNNDL